MEFRIADTFTEILTKLTGEEKEILAPLRQTQIRSHHRERHLSTGG